MTGPFVAGVLAGYGIAIPVGAIAVLIAGLTARTTLRTGAAAALGAATADGLYATAAVLGGAALTSAITPIAAPLRWLAALTLLLLAAWTARAALSPTPPNPAPAPPPDAAQPPTPTPPDATTAATPPPATPGPEATAEPHTRGSRTGRAARVARRQRRRGAASRPQRRGAAIEHATPATAYVGVLALTLLNPATVVYFAALVLGRGGTGGGAWFVAGAFLASASWQLLIAATGALAGRALTSPRAQRLTTLTSGVVIAALALALVL